MPRKPEWSPTISLGNILLMATVLVSAASVALFANWQSTDNREAIQDARSERIAIEVRVRSLETQQARSDERFTNILGYLARIDGRLERIENK